MPLYLNTKVLLIKNMKITSEGEIINCRIVGLRLVRFTSKVNIKIFDINIPV